MPYLLDGNNLVGSVRRTSRPSDEDRDALIREIADRLRRTKARAVLFFDGSGRRGGSLGPLTVRYSEKSSADDAIVSVIGDSRAPQEFVVVTADQGLARRVRDAGAKTLRPDDFWKRFGPSTGSDSRGGEAPVDVEEWTNYFGDDRNRDG
jgi:predicted RNA-binding protein with PIN domain